MHRRLRLAAGSLIASLSVAFASTHALELTADMTTTEPVIAPITTQHSVRIGGIQVRYAATFGELLLSDAGGKPQATISATSYVRAGRIDPVRPVLFAFNGGPGASSSPLHFGALGPSRWTDDKGARTIVTNDHSVLDVVDLVFIDPVGTGFSRVREGGDASLYWNVAGDAQATLTLIQSWLREHDRLRAPVFIAGESYGGFRLATFADKLADLHVAGLIFVSPLLDASGSTGAPGNDLPYIFELPTLAAGAWHHERIDRAGRTLEQHYETAVQFAQTDYAVALQQGSALDAEHRKRLSQRMSALIGLPATLIETANLRIESEQFLQTLLSDRNLILGRLDMRVTAPKPAQRPKDRPPGADDPALGLRGANVIKSEAIKTYLERELGVRTTRDYLSLSLDVNFRWDFRGSKWPPEYYVNPTANVAKLMQQQPHTHVLLLGGYYDLAVPLLAPRYAMTHADIPPTRLQIVSFPAGHSPFEGEENLPRFAEVVRKFVIAHGEGRF
jgi:carboxypeptidase C (cathepsin A)